MAIQKSVTVNKSTIEVSLISDSPKLRAEYTFTIEDFIEWYNKEKPESIQFNQKEILDRVRTKTITPAKLFKFVEELIELI